MNTPFTTATLSFLATAAVATAQGPTAEILVNADIAASTTWTANNTYNLQRQIYVLPGATLTIEAGTVVASTTNLGGSLAVTRGAQIFVRGTERAPVIFTSKADEATWGGNPRAGTWREAANEWGNLTVMGRAYISACNPNTNTAAPNAANIAPMEGLIAAGPNDPNVVYGGGNDDDDSGTISYASIRYAGRVIGLGNELNGLSLGGIGRETDIHHVEIMNNVDDGIEVWGGAVNLSYFSIWNVGDDSLDVDQGWRGKAQFGLVVQGYSVDAAQGSGVGDNICEMDGAEAADYQPVTTATIYNCTFVGQPLDGDHATDFRDNARVQFRNCIFMDVGENVVAFGSGDHTCGGVGYGFNGTLSWAATWTTPFSSFSTVNAPANPAAFYRAQTSGNLIEFTDSVFFNNLFATGYNEANNRNVFAAANNNVFEPNNAPITSISRAAQVTRGGKRMVRVTSLNPRPANEALTSVGFAPNDGFFASAKYRGAFAPGNSWLCGWTASSAFGFTVDNGWCDLGKSLTHAGGASVLSGSGTLATGSPVTLAVSNAPANAPTVFVIGASRLNLPVFGGCLVPSPDLLFQLNANASGDVSLTFPYPGGVQSGTALYFQAWSVALPSLTLCASNGLSATKP